MRDYSYREVYKRYHGSIPKDANNRSYDIHHLDGDHANNNIDNLKAIPIQEHYDIHFANGDFMACVLIGVRMGKTPKELSELSSKAALARVRQGNHHWQTENHSAQVSARVNQQILAGTYHMLGGSIQRKNQLDRVKEGVHQWLGSDSNKKMLANGTHPSLKEFVCPHCGTRGKGSTNAKRWHFDNCRGKLNVC